MGKELVPYDGDDRRNLTGLIPFTVGPDARRGPGGKTSPLDDEEWREVFCQGVAAGLTSKELADVFGMHERTMRLYKKDPRVKADVLKLIRDRIIRVSRKVDSQIEHRLQNAAEIPTLDLLKIRREYLGGTFREQAEGKNDPDVIGEAAAALEDNPNLIAELEEIVTRRAQEQGVKAAVEDG